MIIPALVPVQHRTVTHVMLYWIIALMFFYFVDYQRVGLGFVISGFSHLLGNAFTISGVPFVPWSSTRFHLFGGQLRIGNGGEYIVAGIIATLCFGFALYSPWKICTVETVLFHFFTIGKSTTKTA